MHFTLRLFAIHRKYIVFFPTNSQFTYKNITVRNNVPIGYNATFIESNGHITIGDNTIFSSNVIIRGGRSSRHINGKVMRNYNTRDKILTNDEPIIKEDVIMIERLKYEKKM